MNKLNDSDIIKSVLSGNKSDFALLVERYKDKGYNLTLSMLKNPMDAEEVLQDAFVKAYKSLAAFRGDAAFSTWFYRIVYNSALTFLNSKRRRTERLFDSMEEHENNLRSDDLHSAEVSEREVEIMNLLERLHPKSALIIYLFYIDGLSVREIGGIIGVSESGVKVTLHRARKSLRELVFKYKLTEDLL